jgi:flagellar biosynthesis/type III secretory pathway protein FliH
MSATLTLQTSSPLASLQVMLKPARPPTVSADEAEAAALKSRLADACQAIENAAEGLEQASAGLLASCNSHIAHLAVEIAARILARQISQNDYNIENIVAEAIAPVPAGKQTILRLNPADIETLNKNIGRIPDLAARNLQLVPDSAVGPAQCVLETPDGIIEYLIEEHLKQIESALAGSAKE